MESIYPVLFTYKVVKKILNLYDVQSANAHNVITFQGKGGSRIKPI